MFGYIKLSVVTFGCVYLCSVAFDYVRLCFGYVGLRLGDGLVLVSGRLWNCLAMILRWF